MRAIFHPAARQEARDAQAWYQDIDHELASAFFSELEDYLEMVCRNPESYRPRDHGARRANFRVFPYHLIFRVHGQGIQILAVAHHSRRPNYWIHRTST